MVLDSEHAGIDDRQSRGIRTGPETIPRNVGMCESRRCSLCSTTMTLPSSCAIRATFRISPATTVRRRQLRNHAFRMLICGSPVCIERLDRLLQFQTLTATEFCSDDLRPDGDSASTGPTARTVPGLFFLLVFLLNVVEGGKRAGRADDFEEDR